MADTAQTVAAEPSARAQDENARVVVVSNVAPTATKANVSEFFAFCGPIVEVVLHPAPDGATQSGLVEFGSAAAAETALLLNAALIVDRPIRVSLPGGAPAAGGPPPPPPPPPPRSCRLRSGARSLRRLPAAVSAP